MLCANLVLVNFLSGQGSSLDKWVSGQRWRRNHKRGLKIKCEANGLHFWKTPPGPNTLPRHWVEARLQAQIARGWNSKLFWSPRGEVIGSYNLSGGELVNTWYSDIVSWWVRRWPRIVPYRWRGRKLNCWWLLGRMIGTQMVSGAVED